MKLQFLIESEDIGANEICDAVYTIEKRKSLSDYIAEIMAKLLFHLNCICIIMIDSCCVFCKLPAYTHIITSR